MLIMRRRLFSGQIKCSDSTKVKRLEFSLKLTFDSLILFCVLDNNICFGEENLTFLVFDENKRGEMELF